MSKYNQLNRWELWALAYIVRRGCGDDAFDYFKVWVISKGQEAFEDIKSLNVSKLQRHFDEDPQLEEMFWLVENVYENKTGTALVVQSVFIKQLLPILGFVFLGIILAGMYPAFLLSSYSPAKALKGKIATSVGGFQIRKAMITTQFLATIVLLIGTITVTKQIDFLEKQVFDLGLKTVF